MSNVKTGIRVFDAMTTKPICVQEHYTAEECAKMMKKFSVGSILVKDGKVVHGIITEQDMVYKVVAKNRNPKEVLAREIMVTNLFTVTPDKDIYDAMLMMRNNDIRHLPVVDDDKFVGFLTMKDILKIEPQLFELLVEKIRLREEDTKLYR